MFKIFFLSCGWFLPYLGIMAAVPLEHPYVAATSTPEDQALGRHKWKAHLALPTPFHLYDVSLMAGVEYRQFLSTPWTSLEPNVSLVQHPSEGVPRWVARFSRLGSHQSPGALRASFHLNLEPYPFKWTFAPTDQASVWLLTSGAWIDGRLQLLPYFHYGLKRGGQFLGLLQVPTGVEVAWMLGQGKIFIGGKVWVTDEYWPQPKTEELQENDASLLLVQTLQIAAFWDWILERNWWLRPSAGWQQMCIGGRFRTCQGGSKTDMRMFVQVELHYGGEGFFRSFGS